jgi:hypothetical protein
MVILSRQIELCFSSLSAFKIEAKLCFSSLSALKFETKLCFSSLSALLLFFIGFQD